MQVKFEFDIQNAETYMTQGLKYSMKLNQGCMKNTDKYSEGTNGRNMGGYVMDHDTTRKQETIRHNKSKSY